MMDFVVQESGLDIQFSFYEVPDGAFGSYVNGTWSGIVGELASGAADIAFSPLTITSSRITAVLFTSAYLDIGLELLVGKPKQQKADVFSFLRPFRRDLWLCLVAVAIFMAIVAASIEYFSPFPRTTTDAAEHTSTGVDDHAPRKRSVGARQRNSGTSGAYS